MKYKHMSMLRGFHLVITCFYLTQELQHDFRRVIYQMYRLI